MVKLQTRTRCIGLDGSSFVTCGTCGVNVPCSMAKMHMCDGKDALLEKIVTKTEQCIKGKWVSYDPASTPLSTLSASQLNQKSNKKAPARKRAPKRKKVCEEEAFLNDVTSESDTQQSDPEGESGEESGESEDEESEDEEAAFMRAAAEVIGSAEVGGGVADKAEKKASPSPKKKARGAKQQAMEAIEVQVPQKKAKEYVQCDACGKWRGLPRFCNPEDLPDKWECANMVDIIASSRITCESGQEPLPEGFLSDGDEEEEADEEAEAGEEAQPEQEA